MEYIDLNSDVNLLFDQLEEYSNPVDAWKMLENGNYKKLNNLNDSDLDDVLNYILGWFINVDFKSIKNIIDTPYKKRILKLLFLFESGIYYDEFERTYIVFGNQLSSVNHGNKHKYGFDLSDLVAAVLSGSENVLSEWKGLNSMFNYINEMDSSIVIEDYLDKVYSIHGFDVSMWSGLLVKGILNHIKKIVIEHRCVFDYEELSGNIVNFVNNVVENFKDDTIDLVDLFDVWFSDVNKDILFDKVVFDKYLNMCIDEGIPYAFCLYLTDGVILKDA